MSEEPKTFEVPSGRAQPNPALLASMVDSSADAIIGTDLSGRILSWNAAAQQILGFSAAEMVGTTTDCLIPKERRLEQQLRMTRIAAGERISNFEAVLLKKGGTGLDVSVSLSGIHQDGTIVGVAWFVRASPNRRDAEAALRESEALSEGLMEASGDCINLLSREGELLWTSDKGNKAMGLTSPELLLGQSWIDGWEGPDREAARAAVAAAARGGSGRFVGLYARGDQPKWFDVIVSPIGGEKGLPEKLLAVSRDITERRQAEAAYMRLASESDHRRRFYEAILSNTPDLVYVFGLDHRFTYANTALLRMWGRTWEQAIGKNCLELGYPAWHAAMHDREIDQVVATKKAIRGQVPFSGTQGRRIYDYIFVPVLGPNGEVEAVAGTTRDITERTQFEESLRQSEERFRALVTATSDIVYSTNPDWSQLRRFQGQALPGEQVGLESNWLEKHIHPEDRPAVIEAIRTAVAQKSTFELEHRLLRADGSYGWTFSRAVPLLDGKGEITEWFGATRDVTERRRAEEALRASERLQRLLAEIGESSAASGSAGQLIERASQLVAHALGVSRCGFAKVDVALGQIKVTNDFHGRFQSLAGTYDLSTYAAAWKQAAMAGMVSTFDDLKSDRRTAEWYEKAYLPLQVRSQIAVPLHRGGNWVGIFWAAHDQPRSWSRTDSELMKVIADRVWVSVERKEAEDALRDSEERFRQLGENIPQLAWMADPDGTISWYNRRWRDFTGMTLAETRRVGWEQVHHPDHFQRVLEKLQQAFRSGRVWEDTFPMRGKDGQYRWFLSRAFPIRDGDGKIARWFGTSTDITELVAAQKALQAAQHELEHHAAHLEDLVSQRTAKLNETVGELEAFSYTIAHDMRAPLRAMQGFAAILTESHSDQLSPSAKDLLQRISVSSDRLDQLIQDVLNYSKIVRADLELEPVDMQSLVEEIIQTYPNLQPEKARISIPNPLPRVMGNRSALTQVLANLLGNAAKFTAPGVHPIISIRAEPAGDGLVRFNFEDNGIGIEEGAQKRLFQMFQRAHRGGTYEGTGIGLAIVRKAVERMGGQVGVRSEPQHGSTFWVELKACRE